MTGIKICGLTTREDVLRAQKFGANALGFILAESSRQVSLEQIFKLTDGITPFVNRVAVVVNPEKHLLRRLIKSGLFDCIQFHGSEDPGLIDSIPLKKIKAISVAEPEDLEQLDFYQDVVDYFLFDTRSDGKTGGTGKTFNWDLLSTKNIPCPFILAGGLGVDNIQRALREVKPAAVDINSKIEGSPGIKDEKLLRQVIELIRKNDLSQLN